MHQLRKAISSLQQQDEKKSKPNKKFHCERNK